MDKSVNNSATTLLLAYADTPEKTRVAKNILQWLNTEPPGNLDLSRCDIEATSTIPEEVIYLIKDRITSLSLPKQLKQANLPSWLFELKAIQKLELPDYQDTQIDLKNLRPDNAYDVEIGGTKVNEASVSERAEVFCREMKRDNQVKVTSYDADGDYLDTESAMGYAYLATADGDLDYGYLNAIAETSNKDKMVCTYLAMHDMIIRQDGEEGMLQNKHAEQRNADMGTKDLLEQNVHPNTLKLYEDLHFTSPLTYIAGHSQWGNVFCKEFKFMDDETSRKQFLLGTTNHAMSVYIREKIAPNGRPRYVVTLFDPNLSRMHLRFVTNNLADIQKLTARQFLSSQNLASYYGKGTDETQVSVFVPAPKDLRKILESGTPLYETDIPRQTDEILTDSERDNPGRIQHYLLAKLPLPIAEFRNQVKKLETPEERLHFLEARVADSASALAIAFHGTHNEKNARDYSQLLFDIAGENLLPTAGLKTLLLATDEGHPLINNLLHKGDVGPIIPYGERVITAGKRKLISAEEFKEIMIGKNHLGQTATFIGIQQNKPDAIDAYGNMLITATKSRLLHPDELIEIINENIYGLPAIHYAIQQHKPEIAKSLGKVILQAYGEGLISQEKVTQLNPSPNWFETNLNNEYATANLTRSKIPSGAACLKKLTQQSTELNQITQRLRQQATLLAHLPHSREKSVINEFLQKQLVRQTNWEAELQRNITEIQQGAQGAIAYHFSRELETNIKKFQQLLSAQEKALMMCARDGIDKIINTANQSILIQSKLFENLPEALKTYELTNRIQVQQIYMGKINAVFNSLKSINGQHQKQIALLETFSGFINEQQKRLDKQEICLKNLQQEWQAPLDNERSQSRLTELSTQTRELEQAFISTSLHIDKVRKLLHESRNFLKKSRVNKDSEGRIKVFVKSRENGKLILQPIDTYDVKNKASLIIPEKDCLQLTGCAHHRFEVGTKIWIRQPEQLSAQKNFTKSSNLNSRNKRKLG